MSDDLEGIAATRVHPIWSSDRAIWEREPDQARLNRAAALLVTSPAQALTELQELAENGSVLSMVYLGHAFRNGTGTPIDLGKSEQWYRRAADAGSALAAGILGAYYFDIKQYARAEEFFKMSADRGYLPGMFRLATLYLDEAVIDPQPQKARELLERASALGHAVAKRRLAGLLARGGFGLVQRIRGYWLMLSSFKDYLWITAVDPESDRLRG